MMEIKIPFYNIINMFLTGFVFIVGVIIVLPEKIINLSQHLLIISLENVPEILVVLSVLAIVYESGLIINRIGSVLIESILKRLKIIVFNDEYKDFNLLKKEFPILETLSREYALSRTSATLFFILAIIALFSRFLKLAIIWGVITAIYIFSARKHSSKITELVQNSK